MKISYIKLLNRHISENTPKTGNETPKKNSISYKMRESCVYVENIILCA